MVTAVICGLGNSKIIGSAKFTMSDSHYTTKRVANIISFFTTGFIILIISLLIIIEEWGNGERMTDKDEIKSISEMLISYSFGNIVVAISCRIFGGVYAKGAE